MGTFNHACGGSSSSRIRRQRRKCPSVWGPRELTHRTVEFVGYGESNCHGQRRRVGGSDFDGNEQSNVAECAARAMFENRQHTAIWTPGGAKEVPVVGEEASQHLRTWRPGSWDEVREDNAPPAYRGIERPDAGQSGGIRCERNRPRRAAQPRNLSSRAIGQGQGVDIRGQCCQRVVAPQSLIRRQPFDAIGLVLVGPSEGDAEEHIVEATDGPDVRQRQCRRLQMRWRRGIRNSRHTRSRQRARPARTGVGIRTKADGRVS